MSDIHTMYEQLTRPIGRNLPPLVSSLLPDYVAPRAVENTNERPEKIDGKGQADAE